MKHVVFDVESVGLHGEGFAYGMVVIDQNGKLIWEGHGACHPSNAKGSQSSREWVDLNVPLLEYNCVSPRAVRDAFWKDYQHWKQEGATLIADCGWPVEARFLIACIEDNLPEREWQGAYPFHEIATLLQYKGIDPLKKFDRIESEFPEHNPLNDARQSARIFLTHFYGVTQIKN